LTLLSATRTKLGTIWRLETPLIVKLLAPALLVGTLAWASLDYVQTIRLSASLRDHLLATLKRQSRENHSKLDSYLSQLDEAAALFAQMRNIRDYLAARQADNWWRATQGPVRHKDPPPWLPDASLLRVFNRASFVVLLDTSLRMREVYSSGHEFPGGDFLERLPAMQIRAGEGESVLSEWGGKLFLTASSEVRDEGGRLLAHLAFVHQLDEYFLLTFRRNVYSQGIVAFVDTTHGRVLASSNPESVPAGMPLDELNRLFLAVGRAYFDYSYSSDIAVRFVTLTAWDRIDQLSREVLTSQRAYQISIALILVAAFALILLWISGQVRRFVGKMVEYSRSHLGGELEQARTSRDLLVQMREQFQIMCHEIERTRRREKEHIRRLSQSDKMAALGQLVAGVAHEINTPVGVSLTAASYLNAETRALSERSLANLTAETQLQRYVGIAAETAELIESNLLRAAKLIRNFKQVAVDQTSEEIRDFNLTGYLDQVVSSLRPMLKKTNPELTIHGRTTLRLRSYPGALSQVVTNLVENSINHGFTSGVGGRICLEVDQEGDKAMIIYRDNGRGMSKEVCARVFEPYFTTGRNLGSSGLGMHIVFNLVTQTLGGDIECESSPAKGVAFRIRLPGLIG